VKQGINSNFIIPSSSFREAEEGVEAKAESFSADLTEESSPFIEPFSWPPSQVKTKE
jgi:hypothetical protein